MFIYNNNNIYQNKYLFGNIISSGNDISLNLLNIRKSSLEGISINGFGIIKNSNNYNILFNGYSSSDILYVNTTIFQDISLVDISGTLINLDLNLTIYNNSSNDISFNMTLDSIAI